MKKLTDNNSRVKKSTKQKADYLRNELEKEKKKNDGLSRTIKYLRTSYQVRNIADTFATQVSTKVPKSPRRSLRNFRDISNGSFVFKESRQFTSKEVQYLFSVI